MTKLVGGDSCVTSPRHPQCSAIASCRLTSAANSPPTRWVHLLYQDVLEFRARKFVKVAKWKNRRRFTHPTACFSFPKFVSTDPSLDARVCSKCRIPPPPHILILLTWCETSLHP